MFNISINSLLTFWRCIRYADQADDVVDIVDERRIVGRYERIVRHGRDTLHVIQRPGFTAESAHNASSANIRNLQSALSYDLF